MIETRKDLHEYIELDRIAHGRKSRYPRLIFDYIWKFQYSLRHEEFYINQKNQNIATHLRKLFWRYVKKRIGYKLGFSIPANVFGPGLRINHHGYLVVSAEAKIGRFCDIHQGVNIGQNTEKGSAPTIGDNVWIGPGTKIFGKIIIANNIQIGANSVVNKSFTDSDITIAGIPARKVKDSGNAYTQHILANYK